MNENPKDKKTKATFLYSLCTQKMLREKTQIVKQTNFKQWKIKMQRVSKIIRRYKAIQILDRYPTLLAAKAKINQNKADIRAHDLMLTYFNMEMDSSVNLEL